jgi:hypothetical protein
VTVEIFDADLLVPSALLAIHSKGQHHLAVTRAVDVERFHEFRRSLHDPIVAANPRLTNGPAHFVQLPALVKARQGATDGDRSSYLDDPSITPNLGSDAEY